MGYISEAKDINKNKMKVLQRKSSKLFMLITQYNGKGLKMYK